MYDHAIVLVIEMPVCGLSQMPERMLNVMMLTGDRKNSALAAAELLEIPAKVMCMIVCVFSVCFVGEPLWFACDMLR